MTGKLLPEGEGLCRGAWVRGAPAAVCPISFDPNSRSDRVSPNSVLEPVDLAADQSELSVIVRFERRIAFLLESTDLGFDRTLIDSRDVAVLVNVYAEGFRKRFQQVILVQLRVALHGLVIEL